MSILKKLRDRFIGWLTYDPPTTEVMPYDFNRLKYELRPGDVLLIEGRSRVSSVIRTITQSPWTHACLYIGKLVNFEDDETRAALRAHTDAKDTDHLIIEGLMDRGTVVTPLSEYRNLHIRICRPIGITPSDIQSVNEYAISALGKPYNIRQLLDLMRFLLPWTILPRRWGSSLFRTPSGEPESGICSSTIAEAFSSVQFPILPFVRQNKDTGFEMFQRNPYLFSPKDFDYSPYFEIIKYPLFNPDEPLPYYRRLPWARSGMHQDDGVVSDETPSRKKGKRSQPKDNSTGEE